jgi:hypothetical protein
MQDSVSVRVDRHRPAGDGSLPAALACSHPAIRRLLKKKLNSVACSPQANYTDRAADTPT